MPENDIAVLVAREFHKHFDIALPSCAIPYWESYPLSALEKAFYRTRKKFGANPPETAWKYATSVARHECERMQEIQRTGWPSDWPRRANA